MNDGEADELRAACCLVYVRDCTPSTNFSGIGTISSVGFSNKNYAQWPCANGNPQPLCSLNNEDFLLTIARQLGVSKSKTTYKADIFVNGKGVSLKSHRRNPPAIVNHTARHGWIMAANNSNGNADMNTLDTIIANYWDLRTKGLIPEDISNSSPQSPFAGNKDIVKPFLLYFLSKGSASGLSPYPADYIFDFSDPLNINGWSVFTPDSYVEHYWNRLVFSVRSKKGMPLNYSPSCKSYNLIAPWTRFHQGDYRGALHVRVK